MRIISGSYKGRKLFGPQNSRIRPTSDRSKEMIFNWIQFDIGGKNALDLFAGTGNLGFEALSRAAQHVTFVDQAHAATQIITKNATSLNLQDKIEILKCDTFKAISILASQKRVFDFIFADPPYKRFLSNKILTEIDSNQILNVGGGVILEHAHTDMPDKEFSSLFLLKQKIMGETCISFYEKRSN